MSSKIKLSIIILIIFSLIPFVSGEIIEGEFENVSYENNSTFLIGTLFNPIESGVTVNASAISLVYYNKNIMDENIGIVQGFQQVSFKKHSFFFVYKPGPLGLIAYVFGNCYDFEIIN
jgi:hypothetical protein